MSADPHNLRRIGRGASPWTLYNTLLSAQGAEALPTVDQTVGSSFAVLDVIGAQVIAEQLATGRLPAEVALLYEVPILHFRRWMRERYDKDALEEIRQAAAESLQVKAMLTLSARLDNPAAASQAKALSDRMAKVSEALSPRDWNPTRIEDSRSVPSVTIIMRGLGVDTQEKPVIDAEIVPCSPVGYASEGSRQDSPLPPPPLLPAVDPWSLIRTSARSMSEGLDDV